MASIANGGFPDYALHTLGWNAFQKLCLSIASEILGQTVQSFSDSKDGGRDGAFRGIWKNNGGEEFAGSFTLQCKFTAKANKNLTVSDLAPEFEKAKRLAKEGLAENYFLLTNAKVSGVVSEELRKKFESLDGIKRFVVFGGERICQLIHESPKLRLLVPRIYGLGDLSMILDERAYLQAQEILSSLGGELGKFVITKAYNKSADALKEHGFVLLLGEPACGKTTIAAALAVGAIDNWKCNAFKIRNADDLIRHSNPNDPKQLFWIDDAFGTTQLDINGVTRWNAAFAHMHAAIVRGAKVIFTSRDYIYKQARGFLKETAFPLLKESQVVIRVEEIEKDEKEQILYNHIRLGNQSLDFKSSIKPFLPEVASHRRFKPESARRLGNSVFTKELHISEPALLDFVDRPMDFLCETIRTLDAESRAALALMFVRNGILSSPVEIGQEEKDVIELLGGTGAGIRQALNSLEGSLVTNQALQDGNRNWIFKHPTVRDAFGTLIVEDKELLDIYLAGTPIHRLLDEISCGSVQVQGAKVILAPQRYEALLIRLDSLNLSEPANVTVLHYFLANRCDKEFLDRYLKRNPTFIGRLRIGAYLYAVSDVKVITTLFRMGLLPEEKRLEAITDIRQLAIDIPDSGFLREHIRALFTEVEFHDLMEAIWEKLVPHLGERVESWESNFDSEDDPDSHFSELEDAIKAYRDIFDEMDKDVQSLSVALESIKIVKDKLRSSATEKEEQEKLSSESQEPNEVSSRSIFEDVDEPIS